MNIYKISQSKNVNWDTYDSAVVAAESEDDARAIHPGGGSNEQGGFGWPRPEGVDVEHIGKADKSIKRGVICASFNAG